MIGRADRLEHVMKVIKNINPCVMIVTETEANCNSPTFVRRFVEALFFYGAFFDSLAECMKNDEKNRRSIRNIVAAEGGIRKVRPVSINVWRAFFARFGLVEKELSMSSVYQANMVRRSFPCGSSCTLGMKGKCLTIGWKGTPLSTLSAWKFKRDVMDETWNHIPMKPLRKANIRLQFLIMLKLRKNFQSPFGILNKYGSQVKRLRSDEPCKPSQLKHFQRENPNGLGSKIEGSNSSCQVLSAESILRLARIKFFQSYSQKAGDCFTPGNPSEFQCGLSHDNERLLDLAFCLLDAAENFSRQRYDQAEELIIRVLLASHADHPIERVVTCFARDLRGRIDLEKGKTDLEGEVVYVDVEEAVTNLKVAIYACEQQLPFSQITHFTGIQTILDSIGSSERIHFIDIGIKLGSHWIIIMHALANQKNCPLEQLKITAVCTSKDKIEETGKLLSSFAESVNLPFELKILYSEMNDLKKDMFELEAGEVLAVYLEVCLMSLSACPPHLEALIREIKNLNPNLMVVNEVEANIVASTFIDRFHQGLFLCSAMFDCLEACLGWDNECRRIVEQVYYQEIIRNIITTQDKESFKQRLKIDFWREYFARFGIVEMELSQPSVYQASLLLRESASWSPCTLGMNGKCMLLGWKGTPLRSVSAWKFPHD
ncbi:hypothetical protein Pfo_015884 [Paulownia fortunei]|nr:hypothetical protein Pfo_015884 [Paulownia fortunei]